MQTGCGKQKDTDIFLPECLFFITLCHSLFLVLWTAWSLSPSLLDLNVACENLVREP